MNEKSGPRDPKSRHAPAKTASKKSQRARKGAAGISPVRAEVAAALASATPKDLAALLRKLRAGERRVPPGITLSAFEAGFLAGQLSLFLQPRRRQRLLAGNDHFLIFPPV